MGADLFGEGVEIGEVGGGDDDVGDAGAVGSKELFANAADGEDFATEGDFSGHADVGADGGLGEGAGEGDDEGESGAGAIFGDGAFGDVDVDVVVEGFAVALVEAHPGGGGEGAFLHDFA